MTGAGLAILQARHPGVELRVKSAPARPDGWRSVEAYDVPRGGVRPCFHWYLVDTAGRVWTSPDSVRLGVELRAKAIA